MFVGAGAGAGCAGEGMVAGGPSTTASSPEVGRESFGMTRADGAAVGTGTFEVVEAAGPVERWMPYAAVASTRPATAPLAAHFVSTNAPSDPADFVAPNAPAELAVPSALAPSPRPESVRCSVPVAGFS